MWSEAFFISTAEGNIMPSRCDAEEYVISPRRWRRYHLGASSWHRIDRFQRFLSQIKPLIFYFNLRWELLKSVDSVQSYVHLKSAKNETPRDGIFFIVAARWDDVSLSRRFAPMVHIRFFCLARPKMQHSRSGTRSESGTFGPLGKIVYYDTRPVK